MAWFSSGTSNASLVNNLARNGLITSDRVKNAMLAVDRAHFCPTSPYTDSPQAIGHSATISAPHMHAAACESLLDFIRPGSSPRILDIGSGSGYLTAVLAELAGNDDNGASVVGVDHISQLVELAQSNMARSEKGREWLRTGRVRFVRGDGRLGYRDPHYSGRSGRANGTTQQTLMAREDGGGEKEQGQLEEQWDVIHVGAAAREAHDMLIRQLGRPGRLFIPVGEGAEAQYIWVIDKDGQGNVTRKREMGVRYVPLTDAPT